MLIPDLPRLSKGRKTCVIDTYDIYYFYKRTEKVSHLPRVTNPIGFSKEGFTFSGFNFCNHFFNLLRRRHG